MNGLLDQRGTIEKKCRRHKNGFFCTQLTIRYFPLALTLTSASLHIPSFSSSPLSLPHEGLICTVTFFAETCSKHGNDRTQGCCDDRQGLAYQKCGPKAERREKNAERLLLISTVVFFFLLAVSPQLVQLVFSLHVGIGLLYAAPLPPLLQTKKMRDSAEGANGGGGGARVKDVPCIKVSRLFVCILYIR